MANGLQMILKDSPFRSYHCLGPLFTNQRVCHDFNNKVMSHTTDWLNVLQIDSIILNTACHACNAI